MMLLVNATVQPLGVKRAVRVVEDHFFDQQQAHLHAGSSCSRRNICQIIEELKCYHIQQRQVEAGQWQYHAACDTISSVSKDTHRMNEFAFSNSIEVTKPHATPCCERIESHGEGQANEKLVLQHSLCCLNPLLSGVTTSKTGCNSINDTMHSRLRNVGPGNRGVCSRLNLSSDKHNHHIHSCKFNV